MKGQLSKEQFDELSRHTFTMAAASGIGFFASLYSAVLPASAKISLLVGWGMGIMIGLWFKGKGAKSWPPMIFCSLSALSLFGERLGLLLILGNSSGNRTICALVTDERNDQWEQKSKRGILIFAARLLVGATQREGCGVSGLKRAINIVKKL